MLRAAASVRACRRCTKNIHQARHGAHQGVAGDVIRTISITPAAWCNCWRATRKGLASCSACAPSSGLRLRWRSGAPLSMHHPMPCAQFTVPDPCRRDHVLQDAWWVDQKSRRRHEGTVWVFCAQTTFVRCRRNYEILNRDTDWRSSSAMRESSCTCAAVTRVPAPFRSVTAKMCWMCSGPPHWPDPPRAMQLQRFAQSNRPHGARPGRYPTAHCQPESNSLAPSTHAFGGERSMAPMASCASV